MGNELGNDGREKQTRKRSCVLLRAREVGEKLAGEFDFSQHIMLQQFLFPFLKIGEIQCSCHSPPLTIAIGAA